MRLFRRLKYLIHRNRRERELEEELAFHRVLAEQEHRDSGLSPEKARHAASLQMGNTTLARESAHHTWFPAAVEGTLQDLRYAFRGLSRSKALLVVACLSLGLSTGFGTALFSLVNASILQPVTAEHAERLVRLWVGNSNQVSAANLRDICDETPGVQCAGYRTEQFVWYPGDEPVRLFGQVVSAHYFQMLGVNVAQGRVFTPGSVRERTDTIVVTNAFWERRLASDPNVIGSKLVLTGHSYTIIGVLPKGFRSIWGIGIAPSIYLPVGSAARPFTSERGRTEYELLGRRGPQQNLAEFQSRVLARAKELEQTYPVENREFGRVQIFPFHSLGLFLSSGDKAMRILVLFASLLLIAIVLLAVVACVNVAGLLVARAMARQREIAIRLSVGCGRLRLARLLFSESLLLVLGGVSLGAILSIWLARMLVVVPLPFPVPLELEVPVDMHLFAYLAALVGLATLVVGIAPVMQAWRISVAGGTAHAPRAAGFRRWSMRGVLIAGQVAISTVLLVATTLFTRSLYMASQIDPGFDLDEVVIVESDTRSGQLPDAEVAAYYRNAVERLKALPNVTAVSGASIVPLSMDVSVNSLLVDLGGKEQPITVNTNWIMPDYFRVMGIPIRAGREFAESDRQTKPRAAIVNETFARRLFPGRSAVGQRVRRPTPAQTPDPWAEIVAVVADSRYMTIGEETKPQIYWPAGEVKGRMTLHVRTEADATALARALPEFLNSVDSRVTTRARPLRSVMAVALFAPQAAAVLLAALGLVGWGLTVAGLYGLVAYTVTRRVPEIGLRVALGAPPSNVLRLLLRDGLTITAAGLAVGLGIAALVTPFLSMFLAGGHPRDPVSFTLVAVILSLTALGASLGPARRGMRLSPTEALRNE